MPSEGPGFKIEANSQAKVFEDCEGNALIGKGQDTAARAYYSIKTLSANRVPTLKIMCRGTANVLMLS